LNDPTNIGGDRARIQILRADTGWQPPIAGAKTDAACAIIDLVEELAIRRKG
jgi:hypothetical protein